MARTAAATLDAAVREALEPVVRRASIQIARAVAAAAAERLEANLEREVGRTGRKSGPARRSRPRAEITRWVADRRARRVPTFVIELTGLKTKKQIVAKYGENASFEKGKSAPKAK
jgi:sulfite reductase beta subunit-like hemoprotein